MTTKKDSPLNEKPLVAIFRKFPQLGAWQEPTARWLRLQRDDWRSKSRALGFFFRLYIIKQDLPIDPAKFLARGTELPDFYQAVCESPIFGFKANDHIHDFLEFVLLENYSEPNGNGNRVISKAFCNPVPYVTKGQRRIAETLEWQGPLTRLFRQFPQLAPWRELALAWLRKQQNELGPKKKALSLFFRFHIIKRGLPLEPKQFLARGAKLPNFYKTTCQNQLAGVKVNNHIHDFLEFVLQENYSQPGDDGQRVVSTAVCNPVPYVYKGASRTSDKTLAWVQREYPQLAAWRGLAIKWVEEQRGGVQGKLLALSLFFRIYIVKTGLPLEPAKFLLRRNTWPDFFETTCKKTEGGVRINNHVHAFLQFVLLKLCSETADDGQAVISSEFCNPIPNRSSSLIPKLAETVYSPLPYSYITELREMLAQGQHFSDWTWAQRELGAEIGGRGQPSVGWFEVTEDQIDLNDPDCVWRYRPVSRDGQRIEVIEMWSPVRWVALLLKLILPLRTFQVRMLDSGEADTWRFEHGNWVSNSNQLKGGGSRRPQQQGVFRRPVVSADDSHSAHPAAALLYINTNKTADRTKSGSEKGFVIPWISVGPTSGDVFYWLEKLRNWQEKYNPIQRRTAWSELDGRHLEAKSDAQLAAYSDTCFLFRQAEAPVGERHFPAPQTWLQRSWFGLLEALEQRLAQRGETHSNGSPIRFLPPPEKQNDRKTTLFPLHSLRVSLITSLALDGKVPIEILYRIVGHSRLIMTLYYIKPGMTQMFEELSTAAKRMDAEKEKSLRNFLENTDFDQLLQDAICNDKASLAAIMPRNPAARNPAGWMSLHHGMCLAGGNKSQIGQGRSIAGCINGGPLIVKAGRGVPATHAPVPGGSCVRCRWFVTEPYHLPALVSHYNNLSHQCDEARKDVNAREDELKILKEQRADAEDSGQPFTRIDAYRQAERRLEKAMEKFCNIALELAACSDLTARCVIAHNAGNPNKRQLVAVGAASDVRIVYTETDSELLQISGVCENIEIFPDEENNTAIFRFGQLIDATLSREGKPPVFMLMSKEQILTAGNAFLRNAAVQMNPKNPELGKREVIGLMDAKKSLSKRLGIDIRQLLPEGAYVERSTIDVHPLDPMELISHGESQPLLGGRK